MKLSDKALAAMGAPPRLGVAAFSLDDLPLSKRSDLDDYPGVIAACDGCRLAVSPLGNAYLVQVWHNNAWSITRPFPNLAALSVYLEVIEPGWPAAILAALDGLPVNPADWAAVPLPGQGPA